MSSAAALAEVLHFSRYRFARAALKGSSMIRTPWKVATVLVLLLHGPAARSAGQDAAVVTFDFTDQKFTSEFVKWVARYGARKQIILTDEKTLSDIVVKECGEATDANLKVFELAITEQIVFKGGTALLAPPCLPHVKKTFQARIAASNDRFWNYYKKASGSLEGLKFDDRPIETYSAKNPPSFDDFIRSPLDVAGITSSYQDNKAIYDEFAFDVAKATGSVEDSARSKIAVANFWKRKAVALGPNALDTGQLAYDAAYMKETLGRYGLDLPTDYIVSAGFQPNAVSTDIDRSDVVALATTASSRWSDADFAKSAELATKVAIPGFETADDYLSGVKWFTPDASPEAVKALVELKPGDLVVTPTVVGQQVEIPIDNSLMTSSNAGTVPPPFENSSATVPVIEEIQTFHVDEVAPSRCQNPVTSKWEQPAFAKMFRDAAFRTRLRIAQDSRTSAIEAKVLVADSGFVTADDRGPFALALATLGAAEAKKWTPAKDVPDDQRTHGTSVTGLAIGGPQYWPLASALGIKLEVIPRRIFEARITGGKNSLIFQRDALLDAAGVGADIFNLSFGSHDETQLNKFRERFFTSSTNKLFVIAAGNNNLNDGDKGVDLGSVSIYPQFWAGHETGGNVLLVAALDGDKVASFSNYSATRVSLAAPGCLVSSWKPSGDDARYDEKKVTGTSFSAPIVSYVAALVKAMSPAERAGAAWLRARLIASSDLTDIDSIEHGRVFNAVKAISLYDDVVEFNGVPSETKLLFGQLEWTGELNDICDGVGSPEHSVLLKFARDPTSAIPLFRIYYLRDEKLATSLTCTPRADAELPLRLEDGQYEFIKISDVKDLVFRYE